MCDEYLKAAKSIWKHELPEARHVALKSPRQARQDVLWWLAQEIKKMVRGGAGHGGSGRRAQCHQGHEIFRRIHRLRHRNQPQIPAIFGVDPGVLTGILSNRQHSIGEFIEHE